MTAITPGHKYSLRNFQDGREAQTIQFIEKDAAMNTINDGTTNEEVLAMLLNRLRFLNAKMPCRENSIAITKMEEALLWLNERTAERTRRGVEGTSAE